MFKKIDKYLRTKLKKYKVTVSESERSYYYSFGNIKIRLSDHISTTSKGIVHIIVPDNETDKIIVITRDKLVPIILTYRQLQNFINSLIIMNSIITKNRLNNL